MTLINNTPLSDEKQLTMLMITAPEKALGIIYKKYNMTVKKKISQIIFCPDKANDITQETFIAVWKNFHLYDAAQGRLFPWIVRIARNQSIDYLRSQNMLFHNQQEDLAYVIDTVLRHEISTDHIGLKKLVAGLDEGQKEIIDLMYFQGYTQSEAAEKLDISIGTLKTKIKRAYINLRTSFNTRNKLQDYKQD